MDNTKLRRFKEVLVETTKELCETEAIKALTRVAKEKLKELGLGVGFPCLLAHQYFGEVKVEWRVGDSRFSESWIFSVSLPEAHVVAPIKDFKDFDSGTAAVLAAFADAEYPARIAWFYEKGVVVAEAAIDTAFVEIVIAEAGSLVAMLRTECDTALAEKARHSK